MNTSTLYMSRLYKPLVFLLLFVVMSCTEVGKTPISPKTQFKATVKKNGTPFINIATNDCETLGGYQVKEQNAIVIMANDPETFSNLQIYVYYKDVSELAPGKRLAVANNSNIYPSFVAGALDADTYQSWQTGLEGKVSGTLTIRSFDSATGLASFDLVFDAMLVQGGQIDSSRKSTFTGTFDNVPIFSDENAWSSCNKGQQGFGNNPGAGNNNPSTGNPSNTGGTNSAISFINKTFLPIDITFNGETKTIPFNSSVTFTGKAGNKATGSASCAAKTTSGTQVGLKMQWDLNDTFPASGTSSVNLNVGTDYFFVQITNKSNTPINRLFVNYGLQSQTQDNIVIPADQKLYNIGYYRAYSNSNVRGENINTNSSWSWTNLSLPFTLNQNKSLIANN